MLIQFERSDNLLTGTFKYTEFAEHCIELLDYYHNTFGEVTCNDC